MRYCRFGEISHKFCKREILWIWSSISRTVRYFELFQAQSWKRGFLLCARGSFCKTSCLMTWSPCPPLVYFLSGSSATSTTPSVLPSWLHLFDHDCLNHLACVAIGQIFEGHQDVWGQKVKRGKCGRFSLQYLADFDLWDIWKSGRQRGLWRTSWYLLAWDTQVIKEADVEAQIWQICLLKYLTHWNFMRYLKMKFTYHQKYIWTYKY